MTCPFDLNDSICNKIWKLAAKSDIHYSTCTNCKASEYLIYIVDHWKEMDDDKRNNLKNILTEAGFKELFTAKPKKDINFLCPELNTKIVTDCNLNNCRYWVDYKWSNNCLLAYLMQQERTNISLEEISYLYKTPLAKIQSQYYDAMLSMKRKLLNDRIQAPHFVYYRNQNICCVCECNIQKHLLRTNQLMLPSHLVDDNLELVYCSNSCLKAKPKRLVELEIEYETNIKYILIEAFKMFKDIKNVSSILDITPYVLDNACIRYLGKKAENIQNS